MSFCERDGSPTRDRGFLLMLEARYGEMSLVGCQRWFDLSVLSGNVWSL